MRDFKTVLARIIVLVPTTEYEFHAELEHVQRSARYVPPRAESVCWRLLGDVFECLLPPPADLDHEWQKQIVAVFFGEAE